MYGDINMQGKGEAENLGTKWLASRITSIDYKKIITTTTKCVHSALTYTLNDWLNSVYDPVSLNRLPAPRLLYQSPF